MGYKENKHEIGLRAANFLKRDFNSGVLLWNL